MNVVMLYLLYVCSVCNVLFIHTVIKRRCTYVHSLSCIVPRDDAHSHADEFAEGKGRLGHRAALETGTARRMLLKYKYLKVRSSMYA